MKNKVKYLSLLLLTPLLFLSGCLMGGDTGDLGGFDLVGLINNPIVVMLIFLGVLYWLFKGGGGKK